jgi:hypothetical protein
VAAVADVDGLFVVFGGSMERDLIVCGSQGGRGEKIRAWERRVLILPLRRKGDDEGWEMIKRDEDFKCVRMKPWRPSE